MHARYGLLCDATSRARMLGMPAQNTNVSLMARMQTNANGGDTFMCLGIATTTRRISGTLPFYKIQGAKCFSSGLNNEGSVASKYRPCTQSMRLS